MDKEERNTTVYIAYEEYVPYDPSVPEKNLLRAILLGALSDLKRPGESRRDAVKYFLNQDENYLFSFKSVCNYLSLEPAHILKVAGLYSNVNGNGNGHHHTPPGQPSVTRS